MGDNNLRGLNNLYEHLKIKEIIDSLKNITRNINDYMGLNKLFLIIIYIFNYKFDNEDEKEKIILYI